MFLANLLERVGLRPSAQAASVFRCRDCGGDGICVECDGSKKIDGDTCDACNGTGECATCDGDGEVSS